MQCVCKMCSQYVCKGQAQEYTPIATRALILALYVFSCGIVSFLNVRSCHVMKTDEIREENVFTGVESLKIHAHASSTSCFRKKKL